MNEGTKQRFTAHDIFSTVIRSPLPYDEGIAVLNGNPEIAAMNKDVPGIVSYYSYTLILSGEISIRFNGLTFRMKANDLFICPPGIGFDVLECSNDLTSIGVMAEESFTCQLSEVRDIVKAAYFPILHRIGYMSVSSEEARRLKYRIQEISDYYNDRQHIYKKECLRMLYNLLILDILNIQSKVGRSVAMVSERAENIFIDLIDLIHKHSKEHHDISFYADKLSLVPIYLSRVVKKLTGRTVMDFVNQMLLIEASSLLSSTNLPVSAIAERLHFATTASFSKFFSREIGMSPKAYRNNTILTEKQ